MNTTFLGLAKTRYSVRKYENKAVKPEKLTAILEAGRVAPTAANKQPCVFLVLDSAEALAKLGKACTPHGAPLAIIVCADKPQSPDRHAQTRKPLDAIVKYTTF